MRLIIPSLVSVFALISLLTTANAAIRTISINGKLLQHHETPDLNLPEGSTFNLTFEIDDSVTSVHNEDQRKRYLGAIGNYSFTVPETGFNISGIADATQPLDFYCVDQPVTSPVIELNLKFTNPDTNAQEGLLITWFQHLDGPIPSGELTQDLSLSAFRSIEVSYYSSQTIDHKYCFGWALQGEIHQTNSIPDPLSASEYDRFVVFGDSLSQALNHNPRNTSQYFASGNSNGPIWIEYLSWLTGIPYHNEWNFSELGGFTGPTRLDIQNTDLTNSILAYWSQSGPFAAVTLFVLDSNPEFLAEAIRFKDQSDFLRGIESAYAMGIRHLLLLCPADISITPFVKTWLSPTQQTIVSNMISEIKSDYEHYLEHWFTSLFPGMKVSLITPNTYLDEFMENPAELGITNLDSTHLNSGSTPYIDYFGSLGSSYFFWDQFSFTTKVQARLATRIYEEIFPHIPITDKPPQFTCLKKSQNAVWLLSINPPQNTSLKLEQSDNLLFTAPPLKTFTTQDPLLFFTFPAYGKQNFYRLRE